jgi:hypothetical protein
VLDGVSEGEDTTLRLCLITDIRVLLAHTNHDTALESSATTTRAIATAEN